MTLGTRRYRHIGFQTPQRSGFRNIDMARRTFRDVLFLFAAAFVYELRRDPLWLSQYVGSCREFMTTVAIVGDRLLRLPMTVEAG